MKDDNDQEPLPPPQVFAQGKVLKVVAMDAEIYYDLIEKGFWVGFIMPPIVRGGN